MSNLKVEGHHRFLLKLQLDRLKAVEEEDLAMLEQRLRQKLEPYATQSALMDQIPGGLDSSSGDHRGIVRGCERVSFNSPVLLQELQGFAHLYVRRLGCRSHLNKSLAWLEKSYLPRDRLYLICPNAIEVVDQ